MSSPALAAAVLSLGLLATPEPALAAPPLAPTAEEVRAYAERDEQAPEELDRFEGGRVVLGVSTLLVIIIVLLVVIIIV